MKRTFTLIVAAMMAFVAMVAQENALSKQLSPAAKMMSAKSVNMLDVAPAPVDAAINVYSEDIISEAPAGTVVSNAIRKGYSYYYQSGNVYGGYNDTFVGEYVIGDDGNIYLKTPCCSAKIDSYLKLEKDDSDETGETYICHTSQLVLVDTESSSTPYPYFATRLVYTKYSTYSYGYSVETNADGAIISDIYFTFKDGVLKQKNQEVVDMNGQILPVEMLGLTNSNGDWIGFGDACIEVVSVNMVPTQLPEGAEVKEMSFSFDMQSSKNGKGYRDGKLLKYAEVGDKCYIESPANQGEMWIMGDIDRENGTVTFSSQYLGTDNGTHLWMIPATFSDEFDLWDEEDNYGVWYRNYTMVESLVCKYDNGSILSDPNAKNTMVMSLSSDKINNRVSFADFNIRPYEQKAITPATPAPYFLDPFNGLWGELKVAVGKLDNNDTYVNPDELFYVIYSDTKEAYEFTTDDYFDLPNNMTEIPVEFSDDTDFITNGPFHTIYLYNEWEFFGVQTIHRFNGEEHRSDIIWSDPEKAGINDVKVDPENADKVQKVIEDGNIYIIKGGKKYNVAGQRVK